MSQLCIGTTHIAINFRRVKVSMTLFIAQSFYFIDLDYHFGCFDPPLKFGHKILDS